MQLEIENGRRHGLHGLVALADGLGGSHLFDERVGQRLVGLVVSRKPVEQLSREHPLLVDLRRQLDEVSRRVAKRGIRHVLQQGMQRVPELVKQRPDVVHGHEDRRPWAAPEKVVVVRRERRGASVHVVLLAVTRRPRTRPFTGARKRIEIEETAVRSGWHIRHFPHAHVRMEHRNAAAHLFEGHRVALLG